MTYELTLFTKANGPLTKRISLGPDGEVKSDGSACTMARGTAERLPLRNIHVLARCIERLESNQALALGAMRPGLPDSMPVTTKERVARGTIARTQGFIGYRPGEPAFALLDFDRKGMPRDVSRRLEDLGGFQRAVEHVEPAIAKAARLVRLSTSAGLTLASSGEEIAGSGGVHLYVAMADGADIVDWLDELHSRCWFAGLGWHMPGALGQLLERSIVDRMVSAPERLVFEGPPILKGPLRQDVAARRCQVFSGRMIQRCRKRQKNLDSISKPSPT
jgi:hypothetical protein